MSNQWGRNSQVTRSGGSSGFLLPAILCAVLIAASGYFWFTRQAMQTEIAELEAQAGSLTDQLGKVTAERDKVTGDLAEFRKNSGSWAGELEQEYAELKLNEVPKLNRLLDKRDADISALEKLLSTERAAAKSAADDFTATIAKINADLTAAKSDAASAKKEAESLAAEKLALNTQITSLRSAVERAMADAAAARKALEQKQAESQGTTAFKSALEARDARIETLEQSLGEARRKVAALEKQLADHAAAAAVAKDSGEKTADTPLSTDLPSTAEAKPAGVLTPRDSLLVENVIGATRGLGFLDEEKTQRLKDKLIAGACVTDALESVFDKVPLVLMRNLMRDFKSDC